MRARPTVDVAVMAERPGALGGPPVFLLGCTHYVEVATHEKTAYLLHHNAYLRHLGQQVTVPVKKRGYPADHRELAPDTVVCETCTAARSAGRAAANADARAQQSLGGERPQPAMCGAPLRRHIPKLVCTRCRCEFDVPKDNECPACGADDWRKQRRPPPVTCLLPAHPYDPNNAFTFHRAGKQVW